MHTVLRIDLQLRIGAIVIADNFIDPRRAVPLFRRVVQCQIDVDGHAWVFQRQMRGLVFFMIRRGKRHVGQAVEGDLAIGFRVVDWRGVAGLF